eukprot:964749-Rhodomonas_salina.2
MLGLCLVCRCCCRCLCLCLCPTRAGRCHAPHASRSLSAACQGAACSVSMQGEQGPGCLRRPAPARGVTCSRSAEPRTT